jgi:hypothetical protein
MPMDRRLYPSDWDAIAFQIKDSVNWLCEECDRQCRRPSIPWLQFVVEEMMRGVEIDPNKPQRYTLTVAHLDHNPSNCDPGNLKALCTVCHCRYDLKAMPTKRRLKKERLGQLRLFVLD